MVGEFSFLISDVMWSRYIRRAFPTFLVFGGLGEGLSSLKSGELRGNYIYIGTATPESYHLILA